MYYQDQEIFIDSIKKMLASELAPHVNEWEELGFYPNSVFTTIGAHGFLGILIDEKYGGSGGDYKMASAWCEAFGELASHGLVVGVNMHSVVVSAALQKFGTDEAKDRWLPGAVKGEKIGAYAFTEPGAGSDLSNIRTVARRDGDRWIINGAKTFITNGARAHFILVLAKTDPAAGYKGFTTFLVDTTSPGFQVRRTLDKLGWRASDTAEMSFDDVSVPDSCVLGKVGDGWIQAANNLNWERMMLTLTTLGGMRACARDTLRYATERKAFGKSIGEFASIKSYLQETYKKIVASEGLCRRAIDALCAAKPCKAEVSIAKRLVCEDALWIADHAIQIHGGYGYTEEFSPSRWWRDLRLMPIGGGTSEIMANVVAKELGI